MKRKIAALATCAMMLGVLGQTMPSQAALPYVVKIHVLCKVTINGAPLYYPSAGPGIPTKWEIHCGKNKPNLHPFQGIVDETYCQADVISPGGKKPAGTKLDNLKSNQGQIFGSNCSVNTNGAKGDVLPLLGVGPHCGASEGFGNVVIAGHLGKTYFATIHWVGVGGTLFVDGFFGKAKGVYPNPLEGVVAAAPDNLKKGASCAPTGPGAKEFKVAGTITGVGVDKL